MANYSTGDQVSYVLQWFNSWSEFQREDFIHCMASKISLEPHVNGISNGLQSLDTSGRPPTLFSCQLKLFNDWWPNWNEGDKERFTRVLKESNPEFWNEIEAEISGTRRKDLDDFFAVTISPEAQLKIEAKTEQKTIEVAEEAVENQEPSVDESAIKQNDGESHTVDAVTNDGVIIPEPMTVTAE